MVKKPKKPELDISGPAIVGMALAQSILATLRARGVLSDAEANQVFDTALSGLETQLPDVPSVQQARALIESMMRAAKKRAPK